jgi:hypothetical protein
VLGNIEHQLDVEDLDARLDNMTKRQNCGTPVCPGLNYPPTCDIARSGQRCLVPYHFPMTLGEVVVVAQEAKYEEKLALEEEKRSDEEAAVKKEKLPEFSPDWRFWAGVSAAGIGLFLYRSR